MICEDRETNDNWKKKNNKMILSSSAFNSCVIEFSIPDFNETFIKNIISLFLNIERCEVVFRTHGLCGQYCSEREGRGQVAVRAYPCRYTSFSFYDGLLFHRRPVKVEGSFFSNNHRRQSKVRFFLFLLHGLAFPHFLNTQQVTKAAIFHVSVG